MVYWTNFPQTSYHLIIWGGNEILFMPNMGFGNIPLHTRTSWEKIQLTEGLFPQLTGKHNRETFPPLTGKRKGGRFPCWTVNSSPLLNRYLIQDYTSSQP